MQSTIQLRQKMKTKNMTTSQSRSEQFPLIRVHYVCGVVLILGLALALNAAAQSRVVTEKPIIKPLVLKFPDLWIPTGGDCWWPSPAWNSTDGIFFVAVGNKGNASVPSSSLKVMEYRAGLAMEVGEPWMHFKDYSATVPPLAPGEQKQISVKVAKLTPSSDPQGHPNKRHRRWSFVADGDSKVLEVNEKNNSLMTYTMN
jgi:hypothetical protein